MSPDTLICTSQWVSRSRSMMHSSWSVHGRSECPLTASLLGSRCWGGAITGNMSQFISREALCEWRGRGAGGAPAGRRVGSAPPRQRQEMRGSHARSKAADRWRRVPNSHPHGGRDWQPAVLRVFATPPTVQVGDLSEVGLQRSQPVEHQECGWCLGCLAHCSAVRDILCL